MNLNLMGVFNQNTERLSIPDFTASLLLATTFNIISF